MPFIHREEEIVLGKLKLKLKTKTKSQVKMFFGQTQNAKI